MLVCGKCLFLKNAASCNFAEQPTASVLHGPEALLTLRSKCRGSHAACMELTLDGFAAPLWRVTSQVP